VRHIKILCPSCGFDYDMDAEAYFEEEIVLCPNCYEWVSTSGDGPGCVGHPDTSTGELP